MTQKQIPGYTRSGAYWYLDADGTGPYGVDNTGAPYLIGAGGGGGGGSGSPGIDGILVQDSTSAQGILRTIDTAGVITTQYVHFDGTPWTPSLPVTAVNTSAGMATSSNQSTQITAEQAIQAGVGAPGDAAAGSDVASGSSISFLKRLAARITALIAVFNPGTSVSSTAAEAGHVLKASAGTLFSASVYNGAAIAQWYQIHDSAAAPAANAVPKMAIKVAAGGNGNFDYGLRGRSFANGIYVTNSTSAMTYVAGAADSLFDGSIA